ncbi:MAG: hypothetical protein BGO77_06370 [Caedibacter sp. 37-49]|nr:MAG: hypothetical protein BGO77_06370 [Caedibacter sp. 37-49]
MQQSKWDQERYSQEKLKLSLKEIFLKSPLRYLISICTVVIILFGFWYITEPTYNNLPAGKIPIIKPLEGPVKVRPITNPKENHEDKTIYQKLAETEGSQQVEHLLGGPEEPISRPLSLPQEFIGEFLEDKNEMSLAELSSSKNKQEAFLPTSPTQPQASAELSKEEELEETKSTNVAISGPNVKTINPKDAPPSQERYCLQLGTLKTEEQAKLEWKRLSSRQVLKPYLLNLKPEFKKVDLGNDTGVRIRLIAGSLTKKEAQHLCQELTKLSVKHNIALGCRVKKR